MKRFVWRRLKVFVPTLVFLTVLVFLLRVLIPGGPGEALAGSSASQESIDAINERYGLNQPIWKQYVDWMAGMLRGDFGTSYSTGLPVTDLIGPRIASTFEVVVGGLLVALLVGGAMGMHAAIHRDRWTGRAAFSASALGVSVPVFWVSSIGAGLIGATWGLLPANGYVPISAGLWPHVQSLLMPMILVALPSTALLARQVRSAMVAALDSPYVRTAMAMGLPRRRVHFDLALRNAVAPVIAFLPFLVAGLVGELVIIDNVFVLPGFGSAIVDAVVHRDFATMQVLVLLMAVIVLVLSLISDTVLLILDPRRRKELR